jgi:hypothetical protein
MQSTVAHGTDSHRRFSARRERHQTHEVALAVAYEGVLFVGARRAKSIVLVASTPSSTPSRFCRLRIDRRSNVRLRL